MTVKLHHIAYGDGEPLLILHGLFGSGRNWSSIARQLANRRRVISVDLRNHGESDHADTMSYPEMAADVISLAESLGYRQFNLLGHSLGGKTAMVVSLSYPELVEKLIVIDIAPVEYESNHDELISVMLSLPVDELSTRNEADEILSEQVPDPVLRQFLLQNLVRSNGNYAWRINLGALRENHQVLRNFPGEVKKLSFTRPALFLSGSLSDYVKPEHEEIIRACFPKSEHRIIQDANHWVHADRPEEVVEAISKFMDKPG